VIVKNIINKDKIKSALVSTAGHLVRARSSPDEALGELFADVQKRNIYGDGKVFVDLVPKLRAKQLRQAYLNEKDKPDFDLHDFIASHFVDKKIHQDEPYVNGGRSISDHITVMWRHLERRNRLDRGSLLALPYKYIVPGGRFNEQLYWDSYFIMLGLAVDNNWVMIEGMIKNFAYMMRRFGHIPTANRTYFLSRSQPPFFSHMVRLLSRHKGKTVLVEYLPYLLTEYRFWMRGQSKLSKSEYQSYARLVEMSDGSLLNRYYDNKLTPRPESLREDTETASIDANHDPERLYLHLRAGAESGWDFSTRWFNSSEGISSIHTADIIPIDLNCLLYQLEMTIAESYQILRQPMLFKRFKKLADRRARAINKFCWSPDKNFFVDYDFHKQAPTDCLSLAGVFPLYAKIADTKQAAAVAYMIEKSFLKDGGLMTTLTESGQQWDGSNGWAPLHWIVIEGLRNYGYHSLADDIKQRWVATNMKIYDKQQRLVEKYKVTNGGGLGGGGEYALQDGFGWTNGVLAALLDEQKHEIITK